MEEADQITSKRLAVWSFYQNALAPLEAAEKFRRPVVPKECKHNAHMYYIVLPNLKIRTQAIAQMKEAGINTVFHYVPLHDAPYGKKHGRVHDDLPITRLTSDCLLRLPLWLGVEAHQQKIAHELSVCFL
jgi:dTDP-4-amino-4,6-dideoxygalactose transaminase